MNLNEMHSKVMNTKKEFKSHMKRKHGKYWNENLSGVQIEAEKKAFTLDILLGQVALSYRQAIDLCRDLLTAMDDGDNVHF